VKRQLSAMAWRALIRHFNFYLSRMNHVIRLLPHRNMKFLHLY